MHPDTTYVSFDADNDIHYYRLMQAWDANPANPFDFRDSHQIAQLHYAYNEQYIKTRLRQRFEGTSNFVLLVGEQTKYLYKYVRWEIEEALERQLPIIVVNLNGYRAMDPERCPAILRRELALHISFKQSILALALQSWPREHYEKKLYQASGPFYYLPAVYQQLGL